MPKPTLIPSSIDRGREDGAWMEQALGLARGSIGLAHPNPMVGAVVVKDGEAVGHGHHSYQERDHAEIVALRQAGGKAQGATLYVTLEPCAHTGRTGPCTKAIRGAGVARVVVAMQDPNPLVAGRGFAELRDAGIKVTAGIREDEAMQINEDFACWIRTQKPLVTLKAAVTLDGRIAPERGVKAWITGDASRAAVQGMRHAADAVLTGMGTVLADDPLLTDRTGLPRERRLLRVVVDSQLRLPLDSQIVKTAEKDVLVFTTPESDSAKQEQLQGAGVEVARLPARGRHVELREVIRELGRRQILNLLLEAGAELNGAALSGDLVDKVVLFYAPKVMGGAGVPLAQLPADWFSTGPEISRLTFRAFGPDFAVEGYLHDVYGNHRAHRNH